MKVKKIPKRMCTGCSEMKPKKELLRIVKNKENEITVDLTGKKPGRGAYICKDVECFKVAVKSKRLEKNLGTKISDEIYDRLKSEILSE
ncbi:RNase P modulator RnpM [Clostridium sp. ZS2-4]|uniref:RNase P modulator RnpM n=1 Tax=Clostridium sp. ZS2-4 TaxID=2987703 RepID=UPI00227AD74A|nr:YlxR family protein [Clostridium sp. ZS2-4]MCY6356637.1 YlxR family protein [Clostridium sp. ZS2-4]